MTKIREPPLKPLGLNLRAKQPGTMRGTQAGEVRVSILDRNGKTMQTKIGAIVGSRCFVSFEGEEVEAAREGSRWIYKVPAPEETSDD